MPIEDFIDQVTAGDFTAAGKTFNNLLSDKMSLALDAEKEEIARSTFSDIEDADDIELTAEEEAEIDSDLENYDDFDSDDEEYS